MLIGDHFHHLNLHQCENSEVTARPGGAPECGQSARCYDRPANSRIRGNHPAKGEAMTDAVSVPFVAFVLMAVLASWAVLEHLVLPIHEQGISSD